VRPPPAAAECAGASRRGRCVFVDICNLDALSAAVSQAKPGCILMETISNPLLRVGEIDRIAEMARAAGAALVVDNTFATPLIVRPLDLGASFSVHSLTKYLAGHGDVLGGAVSHGRGPLRCSAHAGAHRRAPCSGRLRATFPCAALRPFRCAWSASAPMPAAWPPGWAATREWSGCISPADPAHPDAPAIRRLFAAGLYGAMVSFEIRDAGRPEIFRFLDRLQLVVRATSLGDVHSMILYPAMSSHRDLAPKHRERVGIRDNLVRLSGRYRSRRRHHRRHRAGICVAG